MHLARGRQTPGKSFRRLVLVNEDAYKRALQCMEEGAVSRMAEQTLWYEKSTSGGDVRRDYLHRDDAERSAPPVPPAPAAPSSASMLSSTSTIRQPVPVTVPEATPELDHEEVAAESEVLTSELHLPTSNRKDVPANHLKKYDSLFRKLRQSGQFQVDESGRVAIGASAPIPGSNFHKLLRSMFVSSFASDRTIGRREFLNALKDAGVRASEVSSQSARVALAAQGGSGSIMKRKGPPGRRERILRVY
jgi:hypothetical protein